MQDYSRPAYSESLAGGLVLLVWGAHDRWMLHVYRPAHGPDNGLIIHARSSDILTFDEMIQLGRSLAE